MTKLPTNTAVLDFWFAAGPKKWFTKEDDFDAEIRTAFLPLHQQAVEGNLDDWADTAHGTLALIIVFDQFSRNLFRNSPDAFAADEKALGLSLKMIKKRQDIEFPQDVRSWIYMPFMHSENLGMQEQCIELFSAVGNEDNTRFAIIHRDIIKKYGRFPHRNAVLGRTSSAAELKFLADGGFSA